MKKQAQGGFTLIELLIVLAIVAIIAALLMPWGMWVSSDVAVRTLQTQGFTDIQVVGRAYYFMGWRGCGEGDTVRFTVTATNPNNQRVWMYVCASHFKGGTIRTP